MKRLVIVAAVALIGSAGCGKSGSDGPGTEQPISSGTAEKRELPSLDEAVDKLKTDLKDAAEAAKAHVAENASAEIERISNQLQEIADDFGKNSDQLEGEAKANYDKMRIEFENKKEVFDQKLKEFQGGTEGARKELLKGLHEALAEMKDALDRAAEAFREGAPPPSETKPS